MTHSDIIVSLNSVLVRIVCCMGYYAWLYMWLAWLQDKTPFSALSGTNHTHDKQRSTLLAVH